MTTPDPALMALAERSSERIRDLAEEMVRENPKRRHYREVAPHAHTMVQWADLIDNLAQALKAKEPPNVR
jgi:hypothetical protein